jgi:hypothetical protein
MNRDHFRVVPEADLTVNYQLTQHFGVSVGYLPQGACDQ